MSKYFTKSFQVSWNDINATGELGLSAYFQYVVETAWAWGAANGLGIAESEASGLAWVIHETEIDLLRPLRAGDQFELTIWLKEWRRVRGTRCFELRMKSGTEVVAQGVQEIVVLDSSSMRPVPAPAPLIEKIRMENPRIVPHQELPKYRIPEGSAFPSERAVEWRDLDWQEHVNNSIYPAFAEEAAARALAAMGWSPADLKEAGLAVGYRRVHIQYPSSASWGEKLSISTCLVDLKSTGGRWYVLMDRTSDKDPVARCELEWSVLDRATGEVREMPATLARRLQERVVVANRGEV